MKPAVEQALNLIANGQSDPVLLTGFLPGSHHGFNFMAVQQKIAPAKIKLL
jgi:hypothetical protein